MNDTRVYHWTGGCGLFAMGLFLVEFPLYFLRGPMPSLTATNLGAYSARNATNMLMVVFLDMLIYFLFLTFLAGFRHLVRQARPECEWVGTLVFGTGVAYSTLTLVADSLEGTIALDAISSSPDPSAIRVLMESQYLMFGSVGLMLIALLLASASYASMASKALPNWTSWLGYAGTVLCLLFVPSMFAGAPDLTAFYNPAGWGTTGVIAGFPLAIWVIAVAVLMVRKRDTGLCAHRVDIGALV
jgi:hypothetical protein